MLLERFYDDTLAQASYLVGCRTSGEALVIDANRDVEKYIEKARAEGLRITHVTETHIHADFVSGSSELAHRTGARLYLSAEGGRKWQYSYALTTGAVLLHEGEEIVAGDVRLTAIHTPGHTPEHLSFQLVHGAATDRAMGIFTGDFILPGDVGDPELLELSAAVERALEEDARTLHGSLARFRELPDWMQIWPGHGAPSDTSDVTGPFPATTSGDEKLVNWALAEEMSEDEFVKAIAERRQEPPPYFTVLKRLNREGPPPRYAASAPTRMDAAALDAALAQASATVIDMRPAPQVESSGVPGALHVPYGREFAKTIGVQVPLTSDIWLIGTDDDGDLARQATNDLALIGFDRVIGWFTPDVPHEWERRVEHRG